MLLKFHFAARCRRSDQTSGMAGPWLGSLPLLCTERACQCTNRGTLRVTTYTRVFIHAYLHVILGQVFLWSVLLLNGTGWWFFRLNTYLDWEEIRSKKSWKRKIDCDRGTVVSKEELLQNMKILRKTCWREIHSDGGL